MISVPIPPHPDAPGVLREVRVPRIDGINFVAQEAQMYVEIHHFGPEGQPHSYFGVDTGIMQTNNTKFVTPAGDVATPEDEGAIPEFAWIWAAIQQGVSLSTLIQGLILRNVARGNFDTDGWKL